jgi:hypothetical protein
MAGDGYDTWNCAAVVAVEALWPYPHRQIPQALPPLCLTCARRLRRHVSVTPRVV